MDRRVRRADKLVGLSKRDLKKAKKEQEEAEVADREKRQQERREKSESVMKRYMEKSDSVGSSDFFDDISVASGSTDTFGIDYARSSEVELSKEDHDKWNTYNENEVLFNSTQFYDEADEILKKVEKEKKKSPKKDKSSSQILIDLTLSPDNAENDCKKRESFADRLQKKKKQEKLKVEREHAKIRSDSHEDFLYSDDPVIYDDDYVPGGLLIPESQSIVEDNVKDDQEGDTATNTESEVSTLTGNRGLLTASVSEAEELRRLHEGVLTQMQIRSPTRGTKRKSVAQLRKDGQEKRKKQEEDNNSK